MRNILEKSTFKGIISWFFVCLLFWVVVFADWTNLKSFRNTWGSDAPNMENKLSAETWNSVLQELDQLKVELSWMLANPSIAIPSWAIMAFDSKSWCPEGWNVYEAASWKFLMWVSQNNLSKVGSSSWRKTVQLSVDNIPPHTHLYKDTIYSEGYEDNNGERFMESHYLDFNDHNIKVVTNGRYDLPGTTVLKNGNPMWSIVWSDEWYDLDNWPYYWVRTTSSNVCSSYYSDFWATDWYVYWQLIDFKGNKLQNAMNSNCSNSYSAKSPVDIEYSNLKVVYCKKS